MSGVFPQKNTSTLKTKECHADPWDCRSDRLIDNLLKNTFKNNEKCQILF